MNTKGGLYEKKKKTVEWQQIVRELFVKKNPVLLTQVTVGVTFGAV